MIGPRKVNGEARPSLDLKETEMKGVIALWMDAEGRVESFSVDLVVFLYSRVEIIAMASTCGQ